MEPFQSRSIDCLGGGQTRERPVCMNIPQRRPVSMLIVNEVNLKEFMATKEEIRQLDIQY